MVLIAEEAMSAGSKPPAAVGVRISTGERHGFGAAAPLSPKTSSQRGTVGGSAFMPKLVELVCRTAFPMLLLNCSSGAIRAFAGLLVCCYVCLHGETWLSRILLKTCWTLISCSHPLRVFLLLSKVLSKFCPPLQTLFDVSPPVWFHLAAHTKYAFWGMGLLPSRIALLFFRSILG